MDVFYICQETSLIGGMDMATSTIVEKIRVNNPKVIEELVATMETVAKAPIERRSQSSAKQVTDSAELKRIMMRGIEKWGKK